MELNELRDHMETMMSAAYALASIPIEEVIAKLKEPIVLNPKDPTFLPQKNDLMVKIFESCLSVKKLMIEIQPEVHRIKQIEEAMEKGTHRA